MWSSNLNNSATFEGGFLDNSRKGDQDDGKLRRAQTLIPVMIQHLNKFPSTEKIKFWGISARMFTFLGIIRNVEETATKLSYDVEDQTGTITALKWLEADRKASDRSMEINTYVRIIGLLREQNEKRHVLILRMWPLTNLNELTNHMLEVTYATLKGKLIEQDSKEAASKIHVPGPNDVPPEGSPDYGMTVDQSSVFNIIFAQNHTDSGIERSDIKAKVPKKILSQVDNILDFLVSEGHIYTTCTDDHFKTT